MNQKIKMVDLASQYLAIKGEIDQAIQNVLLETDFIQGKAVGRFCENLGRHTGANFVIPCANGTDALQIAMMALDLKPGDEVIVPVHTYVATAEVIALLGLTPVFVDVNPKSFNIDVSKIQEKITTRTKAIVPVHLYGQAADMEPLLDLAKRENLFVIEDAAQALGAMYTFSGGSVKSAGTMATIGTTSFFPSKNLGAFGDGGAIFTNDASLAEKMKMISNHGQKVKYYHDIIGINSRLDTLQAAILDVKLKYLATYTAKRNEVASFYDTHLGKLTSVVTPFRAKNSTHVFHQYTIKTSNRDALKRHLEAAGVPTMIYYPQPLHYQKAYRQPSFGEGSFPITEELSKTVLSLPIHTEMDQEQLTYIVDCIANFQ
jgi:UDP-2-acetamido-2-deoxy-ribo-hexuluronate aminotransferase